ncbi:MAG: Gfo/Idh/MocA family protein [Alphaproteobacteria bacterium]
MKKIAVVGAGLIGIRHLKAISMASNATVCALVDVCPKAEKIANEYNVELYNDIETMIDKAKPDGVVIATPNALHMIGAKACISANIPVLVEKPFATNIDEAKEVLSMAKENGTKVLTGYFRRYNPIVVSAKQQIETGALGKLISVHSNFWLHKNDSYYDVKWRTQEGAGPIQINLSHDLDLLLYFMGDVESVTAISNNIARNFEVEDTVVVICKFKNGALGTLNLSDSIPAPWSWELTSGDNPTYPNTQNTYCMIGGTDASLEMPRNRLWYYSGEKHWYKPISSTTIMTEQADSLTAQIEHFSAVIKGDEEPRVTGEDGLRVIEVINAIKESIASRKEVYL